MNNRNDPEKDVREYESRLFPPRMFPGYTSADIKKGLWLMLGVSLIPLIVLAVFGKEAPERSFNGDFGFNAYKQALNEDQGDGVCRVATYLENSRKPHIETYGMTHRLGDCFAVAYKTYSGNPKGYNVGFGLVDQNGIDILAQGYCGMEESSGGRLCLLSGRRNTYRLNLD